MAASPITSHAGPEGEGAHIASHVTRERDSSSAPHNARRWGLDHMTSLSIRLPRVERDERNNKSKADVMFQLFTW
ncbi:hypothetical protein OPV22_005601 [Ensete ventricosum]|uniref:Uncharacterized protein n=1 Tax=Ensete ventricosum TaxID=4639 RepID=A0AAV8RD61_ENSVE|nr:hypothetical protein OPV22_005601 [Ensete ventricosum]